nr:hypothetical protein Iba_chr12cCG1640 [Ipomoea batatas]
MLVKNTFGLSFSSKHLLNSSTMVLFRERSSGSGSVILLSISSRGGTAASWIRRELRQQRFLTTRRCKIKHLDKIICSLLLLFNTLGVRTPIVTFPCPCLHTQRTIATRFISFIALANAETARMAFEFSGGYTIQIKLKTAKFYRIIFEASENPRSFTPFSGLNFTASHSADDMGTT